MRRCPRGRREERPDLDSSGMCFVYCTIGLEDSGSKLLTRAPHNDPPPTASQILLHRGPVVQACQRRDVVLPTRGGHW